MERYKRELARLLKARFPYILIPTPEEQRALDMIYDVAENEELVRTPRVVYKWTATRGMVKDDRPADKGDTKQPLRALEFIENNKEAALFVLLDFHVYFGGCGRASDHQIVRKLRDIVFNLKQNPNPQNVVLISPVSELPLELQKDVTIMDFDLPSKEELLELLRDMIAANRQTGRIEVELVAEDEERLVNAALGLTMQEAENAYARAMVDDGRLDADDVETVLQEKKQIILKSQILEYITTDVTMKDVGGLENLKRWLEKRDRSWLEEARKYCLPSPKGILITGVPGCGKSLTAKAVSAAWQLPILRLDVGKIFSGLVGSSEENIRRALKTAEAVAPSILWIDEIEKGFGGYTSSGDSGTTSRVFATFLTWMQEKTKPVFVVATANNIHMLPPEFMRKGRFDEIFFVDLPTKSERKAILEVHLRKRLKHKEILTGFKLDAQLIEKMADETEGFSGAEIEQAVISGLFEAFAENRSLSFDDILRAARNTVPLSVTQAEEILAIRQWANVRAVAATPADERVEYSSPEPGEEPPGDTAGDSDKTKKSLFSTRGGRTIDF
ncbi:MAG TPA: AAA family ATPase [bacterium]|nr:AAA family ATPase [bacterium]